MFFQRFKIITINAAVLTAITTFAPAAEIRLRPQCSTNAAVVTLGDVAEVTSGDPQQSNELSSVELFPTPTAGEQKFVNVHEIQDLLLLRGIHVADHQFSGSNQVAISRTAAPKIKKTYLPVNAQRTNSRVSEAITQYLNEKVAADRAWAVEVMLPDAQARLLTEPGVSISVQGGKAPWTGSQQFELTATSPRGTQAFPVLASVRASAPCVVAAHNLARGTVIRETDVEIKRTADAGTSSFFATVEEIVGRETTRGLTAGKPVSSDDLRSPLAVRRGDIVTVYVNSGGIRIRTNARAKNEGSVGELISVESMLDRSSFYARVSGTREVEVFALAPQAESAAAHEAASLLR